MSESTISNDAVVIERIFDAPIDVIWRMWTEAEHFKNWYGPQGFSLPVAEMDVRVGGKRLFCMETETPTGSMKMWLTGEYTEIVPKERLVYTESMADEHGNVVLNDMMPQPSEIAVVLEAVGERTKMVMTHSSLPANSEGASEGWEQATNKMAAYVATILNTK